MLVYFSFIKDKLDSSSILDIMLKLHQTLVSKCNFILLNIVQCTYTIDLLIDKDVILVQR